MINALPIVGWIISAAFSISLGIPFWILWTNCGLGAKYFDFLPAKYLAIPFWHCVGLFMLISILKTIIPRFVNVYNPPTSKSK